MPIEGPIKFFSPQNTAGVLWVQGITVISQAVSVHGDQVSNVKISIMSSKIHAIAFFQMMQLSFSHQAPVSFK